MRTHPRGTPARWADAQYGALYYVIDRMKPDKRDSCYEYMVHGGVDKLGLLEASACWSHAEQLMVRIALDLFDQGCVAEHNFTPAGWGEVADTLDSYNFETLCDALRIRRGEARHHGVAGPT